MCGYFEVNGVAELFELGYAGACFVGVAYHDEGVDHIIVDGLKDLVTEPLEVHEGFPDPVGLFFVAVPVDQGLVGTDGGVETRCAPRASR